MKGFVYAYEIGTSHIRNWVNVFNIKDLARVMHVMFQYVWFNDNLSWD